MNTVTIEKTTCSDTTAMKLEWSENDIQIMRQELICEALTFLSNSENKVRFDKKRKNELIKWLFSTKIAPFSSEVCFESMNMDGEATRDFITKYIISGFDFELGVFL